MTLTLDTSCVSAGAAPQPSDPPDEVAAIVALIDLAREGRVRLQLTAAYERDVERWRDDVGRAQRAAWLAKVPIKAVGGVFRLDVSVLGGPDVLAGNADVSLNERLKALLAPTTSARHIAGYEEAPGVAAKVFSDIDHLIAHVKSGADAFVTLDLSTILGRRVRLAEAGIRVCTPTEALALLQPQGGSGPGN